MSSTTFSSSSLLLVLFIIIIIIINNDDEHVVMHSYMYYDLPYYIASMRRQKYCCIYYYNDFVLLIIITYRRSQRQNGFWRHLLTRLLLYLFICITAAFLDVIFDMINYSSLLSSLLKVPGCQDKYSFIGWWYVYYWQQYLIKHCITSASVISCYHNRPPVSLWRFHECNRFAYL